MGYRVELNDADTRVLAGGELEFAEARSVALGYLRERLELIGKERGQPVHLNIADLTDAHGNPTGTKVTLHIPILIED